MRDDVSPLGQASPQVDAPGAPSAPAASAAASPAPPLDDPKVPMPGPARKRLAAAVKENAACEECHDDEAKEWRGSYHQRANVEPAYQGAFAIEPSAFCRSCHAPEADPLKEPPKSVSELGVACVTCHVTEDGLVLAAERAATDPSRAPAPHPLRRSKAFAHAGGCAGCHEFRFPMPGGKDDEFFMQTTAREHERSHAASKPCADCHMPLRRGRRSHAFAEVRDEAWLRANLDARAERAPDDVLRVTLVQPNPGHDFPTGDLFRRLQVGYVLSSASGQILRREARYLARHFEFIPGSAGRRLTHDDRVGSEPAVVELDLPTSADGAPQGATITWWVTYQRVATIGRGTDPEAATIESEIKLHSGTLPLFAQTPSPGKTPL